MSQGIDIIHHAGFSVKNVDSAVLQLERLGFEFTPTPSHGIEVLTSQEGAALGVGGPAAVFRRNYFEITGLPDGARSDGLRTMYLGANNLDAICARFRRDGIEVSEIAHVRQRVATPDGPKVIRWKSLQFLQGNTPEPLLRIAQHVTPDSALRARFASHPNGAQMLTACIVCGEDSRFLAAKYSRYTGKPVHRSDESYVINLGYSRVRIVDPECLRKMVPNIEVPALPALVGFAVATSDLDLARQALHDGQIEFVDRGERLVVPPAHACGSAVLFEPAEVAV
jgi:hypothetical protein